MSSDYAQAFTCGVEAWSKYWGDPLFSATVMMATYAFAAFMAVRVLPALAGMERFVWAVGAFLLAFQIFNTPLDLHSLLWASARCLAHIQGWYAERHAYQRELLGALALCVVFVFGITLLVVRRDLLANGLFVIGLGLSFGMTIVEAIGYHDLEAIYVVSVGPLTLPDLIELSGVGLVLLAAYLKRRRPARV